MKFITIDDFKSILETISESWSKPDPQLAVSQFTSDAIYMQPPNIQFYKGRDQLRKYFGALTEGYFLEFHNIWFNESKQNGASEFSFGLKEDDIADTGVVVIEVLNGLIKIWREYFVKGPKSFNEFISPEKDWKWHIGNYP